MLCTEAALAAMRRRYPQVYESERKLAVDPRCDPRWRWDLAMTLWCIRIVSLNNCTVTAKLAIDPSTIAVTAPDFASALQRIVPAAHRSAVAHATPLAPHLEVRRRQETSGDVRI
jgi:SpoVK/Ycf46/Vps4 family AAA+-type ATPase